jgi:hypothetical protein
MTTQAGVRRPLTALVAVALCSVLVALLGVGAAMLVSMAWSVASEVSPYESGLSILAIGTAIGAVLAAAAAAVHVWAASGLVTGAPRAAGRAMLAGAMTLVLAMTFGTIVDARLALALAAGAVALVVLVNLRSVRSWVTAA